MQDRRLSGQNKENRLQTMCWWREVWWKSWCQKSSRMSKYVNHV